MPMKKKAVLSVVENTIVPPTPAERAAKKVADFKSGWREKRERVHKGLTNANVEAADG